MDRIIICTPLHWELMNFKKLFLLISLIIIGICAIWFLKQPSLIREEIPFAKETAPQTCPEIMPEPGEPIQYSACAGYLSLNAPIAPAALTIEGTIPDWLDATIVRTGPALFDMAGQTFKYWFDGFALLQKIAINKKGIEFAAAFLESDYYKRAQKDG